MLLCYILCICEGVFIQSEFNHPESMTSHTNPLNHINAVHHHKDDQYLVVSQHPTSIIAPIAND